MNDQDLAREVGDLITEWRKTCATMGIPYSDRQAARFVIDSGLIGAAHDRELREQIAKDIEGRAHLCYTGPFAGPSLDAAELAAYIARGNQ